MSSNRLLRPVLTLLLCSGLLGCMTSAMYAPPGVELAHLSPAPLGSTEVGDRYYYSNGRKERVTAVGNGLIDVRRSSRYQYLRFQDFVLMEKAVKRRNALTNIDLVQLTPEKSLWPLAMGSTVRFGLVKTVAGVADGTPDNPKNFWECAVAGMQTVTVISGEFDTYRIECIRKSSRNKIKQYVTYYYAPDIQQVVLRVDRYAHKPAKSVELVAFKPSLAMLSKSSERRYWQHFQNTLESLTSGTTASWWSRKSDTRIHTTPTRTWKIGANLYCRSFLIRVNNKGSVRSGAGFACRDEQGRWRIPTKVAADKSGVTF